MKSHLGRRKLFVGGITNEPEMMMAVAPSVEFVTESVKEPVIHQAAAMVEVERQVNSYQPFDLGFFRNLNLWWWRRMIAWCGGLVSSYRTLLHLLF